MTTTESKGGLPQTFFHLDRWSVISSFHKELRRGDLDQALYWLQFMRDGGAPNAYLVRYLWEICAEELAVTELDVVNYIANCRAQLDRLNDYHFYQMVTLFVQAKKWWECEVSTKMRELRFQHVQTIREAKKYREVPHYAHDKHTTTGKKLVAEGKADRRWEGTWTGMFWRRRAFVLAQEKGVSIDTITWADVWDADPAFYQLSEHVEAKVC